ncbi:MAG: 16S rRNA (cytidine(1402)-2'-O)-methyltransferase [Sphingomicrobium sp.]
MSSPLAPGLYIVATPIGNLSDLSPRAAATLRDADLVLAEDKRVSAKLLAHTGSKARMMAYHDHSDGAIRDSILARLGSEAVALVSDAGTPLISDPGYKLVRAARQAGLSVHTIPGPCAAIAALTLAGLPTDRFLFAGFLPAKAKGRSDAIAELSSLRASLVFYESGPRLADCLAALGEGLGDRDAAIAREISKLHEECVTGTLGELAARYAEKAPKGEIVIVVGPPAQMAETTDDDLDAALVAAMAHQSISRAAAEVAAALGMPRKRAYARALELGGGS